MAASITEIARLANLSANTVSRAMRGAPGVKAETAERVRCLAEQLGYIPNRFAQGLVSKRSKLVAMAITEPESSYQSVIVRRLRDNLRNAGYQSLVMAIDHDDAGRQSETLLELAGMQAEGIIIGSMYGILSEMPIWEPLQQLKRRGIPFAVYGLGSSRKVDMVTIDYYNLIRDMAEHLIEEGKRDILLFDVSPSSERAMGYGDAMRHHRLPPRVVCFPHANMPGGQLCVSEYLAAGNPLPEVIMARNDEMAIGIMAGLRDRGVRVPDDVWVTGFDNIEIAAYSAPRLTSAWVDPLRTADETFALLMRRLEQGGADLEPEQRLLKGELFVRESTGAAAAAKPKKRR